MSGGGRWFSFKFLLQSWQENKILDREEDVVEEKINHFVKLLPEERNKLKVNSVPEGAGDSWVEEAIQGCARDGRWRRER